MIIQPTHEQTRRINRKRSYSGSGFGPRSLECLGMGLGLGLNSGSGAQPANPLNILGATATKLWLRADLGVSAMGTSGATWVDQSGNWGANFIQATTTKQASLGTDGTIGQSAFTFDGADDTWNSTGSFPIPGTNPYAIIIVAKISSYAAASKPLIGADSYAPGLATQSSGHFGPQDGALGPVITSPATTWKRIICELTNSTSDRIQQGSVSVTSTSSGNGRGPNSYIGGLPVDGAWLACAVAEAIVVTPVPSSYTALDAYMTARYGSLVTS